MSATDLSEVPVMSFASDRSWLPFVPCSGCGAPWWAAAGIMCAVCLKLGWCSSSGQGTGNEVSGLFRQQ